MVYEIVLLHIYSLRKICTNCYAENTIKELKVCGETPETAFDIAKVIKFSLKRNAEFNKITEEEDECIGICEFVQHDELYVLRLSVELCKYIMICGS